MSGHSKWSTIKRAKGVNDVKRSQNFTKMANAIAIAARLGNSGDAEANPRLRMAIEEARAINLPKENIQRAVDRGLGRLPGQMLEEVTYEGFGPGKVAFFIEVVTDNKNRTLQEMRNLFERAGGALGASGSTAYLFDKKGEIKVLTRSREVEDEILELIDLGADEVEDFLENGQTKYLVYTDPNKLNEVSKNITQSGFTALSATISYIPNLPVEITDSETAEKVLNFAEKLEDHDDVQKVYANFDIPAELV